MWFRGYSRGQTDTQTNIYSSQYFATAPVGAITSGGQNPPNFVPFRAQAQRNMRRNSQSLLLYKRGGVGHITRQKTTQLFEPRVHESSDAVLRTRTEQCSVAMMSAKPYILRPTAISVLSSDYTTPTTTANDRQHITSYSYLTRYWIGGGVRLMVGDGQISNQVTDPFAEM